MPLFDSRKHKPDYWQHLQRKTGLTDNELSLIKSIVEKDAANTYNPTVASVDQTATFASAFEKISSLGYKGAQREIYAAREAEAFRLSAFTKDIGTVAQALGMSRAGAERAITRGAAQAYARNAVEMSEQIRMNADSLFAYQNFSNKSLPQSTVNELKDIVGSLNSALSSVPLTRLTNETDSRLTAFGDFRPGPMGGYMNVSLRRMIGDTPGTLSNSENEWDLGNLELNITKFNDRYFVNAAGSTAIYRFNGGDATEFVRQLVGVKNPETGYYDGGIMRQITKNMRGYRESQNMSLFTNRDVEDMFTGVEPDLPTRYGAHGIFSKTHSERLSNLIWGKYSVQESLGFAPHKSDESWYPIESRGTALGTVIVHSTTGDPMGIISSEKSLGKLAKRDRLKETQPRGEAGFLDLKTGQFHENNRFESSILPQVGDERYSFYRGKAVFSVLGTHVLQEGGGMIDERWGDTLSENFSRNPTKYTFRLPDGATEQEVRDYLAETSIDKKLAAKGIYRFGSDSTIKLNPTHTGVRTGNWTDTFVNGVTVLENGDIQLHGFSSVPLSGNASGKDGAGVKAFLQGGSVLAATGIDADFYFQPPSHTDSAIATLLGAMDENQLQARWEKANPGTSVPKRFMERMQSNRYTTEQFREGKPAADASAEWAPYDRVYKSLFEDVDWTHVDPSLPYTETQLTVLASAGRIHSIQKLIGTQSQTGEKMYMARIHNPILTIDNVPMNFRVEQSKHGAGNISPTQLNQLIQRNPDTIKNIMEGSLNRKLPYLGIMYAGALNEGGAIPEKTTGKGTPSISNIYDVIDPRAVHSEALGATFNLEQMNTFATGIYDALVSSAKKGEDEYSVDFSLDGKTLSVSGEVSETDKYMIAKSKHFLDTSNENYAAGDFDTAENNRNNSDFLLSHLRAKATEKAITEISGKSNYLLKMLGDKYILPTAAVKRFGREGDYGETTDALGENTLDVMAYLFDNSTFNKLAQNFPAKAIGEISDTLIRLGATPAVRNNILGSKPKEAMGSQQLSTIGMFTGEIAIPNKYARRIFGGSKEAIDEAVKQGLLFGKGFRFPVADDEKQMGNISPVVTDKTLRDRGVPLAVQQHALIMSAELIFSHGGDNDSDTSAMLGFTKIIKGSKRDEYRSSHPANKFNYTEFQADGEQWFAINEKGLEPTSPEEYMKRSLDHPADEARSFAKKIGALMYLSGEDAPSEEVVQAYENFSSRVFEIYNQKLDISEKYQSLNEQSTELSGEFKQITTDLSSEYDVLPEKNGRKKFSRRYKKLLKKKDANKAKIAKLNAKKEELKAQQKALNSEGMDMTGDYTNVILDRWISESEKRWLPGDRNQYTAAEMSAVRSEVGGTAGVQIGETYNMFNRIVDEAVAPKSLMKGATSSLASNFYQNPLDMQPWGEDTPQADFIRMANTWNPITGKYNTPHLNLNVGSVVSGVIKGGGQLATTLYNRLVDNKVSSRAAMSIVKLVINPNHDPLQLQESAAKVDTIIDNLRGVNTLRVKGFVKDAILNRTQPQYFGTEEVQSNEDPFMGAFYDAIRLGANVAKSGETRGQQQSYAEQVAGTLVPTGYRAKRRLQRKIQKALLSGDAVGNVVDLLDEATGDTPMLEGNIPLGHAIVGFGVQNALKKLENDAQKLADLNDPSSREYKAFGNNNEKREAEIAKLKAGMWANYDLTNDGTQLKNRIFFNPLDNPTPEQEATFDMVNKHSRQYQDFMRAMSLNVKSGRWPSVTSVGDYATNMLNKSNRIAQVLMGDNHPLKIIENELNRVQETTMPNGGTVKEVKVLVGENGQTEHVVPDGHIVGEDPDGNILVKDNNPDMKETAKRVQAVKDSGIPPATEVQNVTKQRLNEVMTERKAFARGGTLALWPSGFGTTIEQLADDAASRKRFNMDPKATASKTINELLGSLVISESQLKGSTWHSVRYDKRSKGDTTVIRNPDGTKASDGRVASFGGEDFNVNSFDTPVYRRTGKTLTAVSFKHSATMDKDIALQQLEARTAIFIKGAQDNVFGTLPGDGSPITKRGGVPHIVENIVLDPNRSEAYKEQRRILDEATQEIYRVTGAGGKSYTALIKSAIARAARGNQPIDDRFLDQFSLGSDEINQLKPLFAKAGTASAEATKALAELTNNYSDEDIVAQSRFNGQSDVEATLNAFAADARQQNAWRNTPEFKAAVRTLSHSQQPLSYADRMKASNAALAGRGGGGSEDGGGSGGGWAGPDPIMPWDNRNIVKQTMESSVQITPELVGKLKRFQEYYNEDSIVSKQIAQFNDSGVIGDDLKEFAKATKGVDLQKTFKKASDVTIKSLAHQVRDNNNRNGVAGLAKQALAELIYAETGKTITSAEQARKIIGNNADDSELGDSRDMGINLLSALENGVSEKMARYVDGARPSDTQVKMSDQSMELIKSMTLDPVQRAKIEAHGRSYRDAPVISQMINSDIPAVSRMGKILSENQQQIASYETERRDIVAMHNEEGNQSQAAAQGVVPQYLNKTVDNMNRVRTEIGEGRTGMDSPFIGDREKAYQKEADKVTKAVKAMNKRVFAESMLKHGTGNELSGGHQWENVALSHTQGMLAQLGPKMDEYEAGVAAYFNGDKSVAPQVNSVSSEITQAVKSLAPFTEALKSYTKKITTQVGEVETNIKHLKALNEGLTSTQKGLSEEIAAGKAAGTDTSKLEAGKSGILQAITDNNDEMVKQGTRRGELLRDKQLAQGVLNRADQLKNTTNVEEQRSVPRQVWDGLFGRNTGSGRAGGVFGRGGMLDSQDLFYKSSVLTHANQYIMNPLIDSMKQYGQVAQIGGGLEYVLNGTAGEDALAAQGQEAMGLDNKVNFMKGIYEGMGGYKWLTQSVHNNPQVAETAGRVAGNVGPTAMGVIGGGMALDFTMKAASGFAKFGKWGKGLLGLGEGVAALGGAGLLGEGVAGATILGVSAPLVLGGLALGGLALGGKMIYDNTHQDTSGSGVQEQYYPNYNPVGDFNVHPIDPATHYAQHTATGNSFTIPPDVQAAFDIPTDMSALLSSGPHTLTQFPASAAQWDGGGQSQESIDISEMSTEELTAQIQKWSSEIPGANNTAQIGGVDAQDVATRLAQAIGKKNLSTEGGTSLFKKIIQEASKNSSDPTSDLVKQLVQGASAGNTMPMSQQYMANLEILSSDMTSAGIEKNTTALQRTLPTALTVGAVDSLPQIVKEYTKIADEDPVAAEKFLADTYGIDTSGIFRNPYPYSQKQIQLGHNNLAVGVSMDRPWQNEFTASQRQFSAAERQYKGMKIGAIYTDQGYDEYLGRNTFDVSFANHQNQEYKDFLNGTFSDNQSGTSTRITAQNISDIDLSKVVGDSYQGKMITYQNDQMDLERKYWDFKHEQEEVSFQFEKRAHKLKMSNMQLQLDKMQDTTKIEKKMQATQRGYQLEDFATQEHRLGVQTQWQLQDFAKQAERMDTQRSWQVQDFAQARETFEMQAGWQSEDMDRAIRYASGRKRLDLKRQQERQEIVANQQRKTMTTQKNRAATQFGWSEDDLNTAMARFDVVTKWKEEDLQRDRDRFSELNRLQDELNGKEDAFRAREIANLKEQMKLEEDQWTQREDWRPVEKKFSENMHDLEVKISGEKMHQTVLDFLHTQQVEVINEKIATQVELLQDAAAYMSLVFNGMLETLTQFGGTTGADAQAYQDFVNNFDPSLTDLNKKAAGDLGKVGSTEGSSIDSLVAQLLAFLAQIAGNTKDLKGGMDTAINDALTGGLSRY